MLECSTLNTLTSCLQCSHNLSEESHKSLEEFEHQAGLTESGYYPHKGLSAEETHIHRRGDVTLPVSINSFNHWPQVTMNSKENAHLNVICQKVVVVIIIKKSTLKKTHKSDPYQIKLMDWLRYIFKACATRQDFILFG